MGSSGGATPGLYVVGNTMAAPSGEVHLGGDNPIGRFVLFGYIAPRHMTG